MERILDSHELAEMHELVGKQIFQRLEFDRWTANAIMVDIEKIEYEHEVEILMDIIEKLHVVADGDRLTGGHYWDIVIEERKRHGSLQKALDAADDYTEFKMALCCIDGIYSADKLRYIKS